MIFKPVTTEKAVRMIEGENTLIFAVERREARDQVKKDFEKTFDVKIERINIINKKNEKYAIIKLKKGHKAIDIATKLGMI